MARQWILRPYESTRAFLTETEDFFLAGTQMTRTGPPSLENATKRLFATMSAEYQRLRANGLIKKNRKGVSKIEERAKKVAKAREQVTEKFDALNEFLDGRIEEINEILEGASELIPFRLLEEFANIDQLQEELDFMQQHLRTEMRELGAGKSFPIATIDANQEASLTAMDSALRLINELRMDVFARHDEIKKAEKKFRKAQASAFEADMRTYKRQQALDRLESLRHGLHQVILKRIANRRKLGEISLRIEELSYGKNPTEKRRETEVFGARYLKQQLQDFKKRAEQFADAKQLHTRVASVQDIAELGRRPQVYDVEKCVGGLVLNPGLRSMLMKVLFPVPKEEPGFIPAIRYGAVHRVQLERMIAGIEDFLNPPKEVAEEPELQEHV